MATMVRATWTSVGRVLTSDPEPIRVSFSEHGAAQPLVGVALDVATAERLVNQLQAAIREHAKATVGSFTSLVNSPKASKGQ